jgi:hypothetical protein
LLLTSEHRESALLPGSNDDSASQHHRESALLPGSNDDWANGYLLA